MSQIKTTEIGGDVAISRHVTTGGNATIQGNTVVKKNLTVEGWLEAKNIKAAAKGVFRDVSELRETYPCPHNGWWALVGDSLPAPLYVAYNEKWHATGKSAGNPTIDCKLYKDLAEALSDAFATLSADFNDIVDKFVTHVNEYNIFLSSFQSYKNQTDNSLTGINNCITDIVSSINEITKDLTDINNCIKEIQSNPDFPAFAGTLFLIDDPKMQSYAGDDYSVVFLSSHNKFAAKVPANAIIGAEYYFNWSTADMYMDSSRTYPLKGRLWRGPGGILYYWDGETLLPVCGSNGGSSGEDPDVRKDLEDIGRRVSAIEDSGFVDEKRVKELINLFEVSSGSDSEQCGCPAISFAEIDSLFDSEQDVNPDLPEDAERISEAEINSMLAAPPVAQCPHEPYTGQGISIAELDALIQAT